MRKILGIIPARYASTRFPGKPLVQIQGKSMIRRVWEQACKAESLSGVVVATDDERIVDEVISFGGNVIMTSPEHATGTDRCREAAEMAEMARGIRYDAVINIQGDEPFINPEQINQVASCFQQPLTELATLVKRLQHKEELWNPNIIKVVVSLSGKALYFSRNAIPYVRGTEKENWMEMHRFYKHIGIYGYRRDILDEITRLGTSTLEKAESLEQLRWLENGYTIQVKETEFESRSVDSPEDVKHFE
jgi:3-deoxy-manno-octulosonate cytidylyltransferase (CMP-KDO synthetase)